MPLASPGPPKNLSLSITNPLILYRALVVTKKIKPDPAQHRLALQLQKLYFRLKDYAPEVEYRYRLERIARRSGTRTNRSHKRQDDSKQREPPSPSKGKSQTKGFGLSALMKSQAANTLALTRTAPLHNSALTIPSPQGMLLYGEVGRGKSMLLDLLYNSLPSRKKRRWHFNTFMLDMYQRIEATRLERLESREFFGQEGGSWLFGSGTGVSENEHVVLSLAKETVSDNPILFLDEFQMPDRTASKLINSFFTAFFHLGGVLVASSSRMPEELSKAAGIEFGSRAAQGWANSGGFWGLGWGTRRESQGELQAKSDFGMFLEVLKARCEVWEMEGERDYRREDNEAATPDDGEDEGLADLDGEESKGGSIKDASEAATSLLSGTASAIIENVQVSSDSPPHYHIALSATPPIVSAFQQDILSLNPSDEWTPSTLTVYARQLRLPYTNSGILKASFSSLCATYLGPADYVSLCSTFHTLIVTDVPVLTALQKNEARRFITLLDALYEARCRLLIEAEAPPDKLFFPETRRKLKAVDENGSAGPLLLEDESDSITSEAFSEIYQDSTAPFRPNITSYTESNNATSIPSQQSFTRSLQSPSLRSVLADEDADFGPTYGNGRTQGASSGNINLDLGPPGMAEHELRQGPDFTQTSALTGEDERFAYKRARSRLWEMCGRRWWDERGSDKEIDEWWTPVGKEGRGWEQVRDLENIARDIMEAAQGEAEDDAKTDALFKHNASPFRTSPEPPPKFGWQHAWGMMKWGRKAGEWGKGVEGDRNRKEHESEQPDKHHERKKF